MSDLRLRYLNNTRNKASELSIHRQSDLNPRLQSVIHVVVFCTESVDSGHAQFELEERENK